MRITCRKQGNDVAVNITDTGVGMTEAFVSSQLFKPFESTKEGGFGIGAYEARALAISMGGQLRVDSRVGKGTTFTLLLPIARKKKTKHPHLHGRGRLNMMDVRQKLLIVEDDLGLQKQLKWSYEDFDVYCASNRDEAMALLRSEEPDVVTLDLGLPPDPDGTTEGFAVLDEMLKLKPDTKVIVASGHGAKESALRAIAAGAWDFYQKPVDIDELHLIVKRAFHVRSLEMAERACNSPMPTANCCSAAIISASPEMVKVARTIERVATTNVSVMLLGASGTGKELLARGLHDASDRADETLRCDQLRCDPGKSARIRIVRS